MPHSHILSEHGGGWFHTVNIRVRDLNVWNQIAATKSLDKVRELQADSGHRREQATSQPSDLDRRHVTPRHTTHRRHVFVPAMVDGSHEAEAVSFIGVQSPQPCEPFC